MSRNNGTYTLATARQWVSLKLANVAMMLTTVMAVVWSFNLWRLFNGSTVSEADMQLYAWSYVVDEGGRVVGHAYPPILLWVGLLLFGSFSRSLGPDPNGLGVSPAGALTGPFSAEEKRIGKAGRSDRRRRRRDAFRNVKGQLRERGHAGLFYGRVSLRLGLGLLGAVLVLVTSLLAPTSVATTGETISDAQKGSLPWISLVAGALAVLALLLSFPYGPRGKVVVDAAGNVRGADERHTTQPPQVPAHA